MYKCMWTSVLVMGYDLYVIFCCICDTFKYFGNSEGDPEDSRRKLRNPDSHWLILPLVLMLYLPHPVILCGSYWYCKSCCHSPILCKWLWSFCEDCRMNCGSFHLWRKRSTRPLRPQWEVFVFVFLSSLNKPSLIFSCHPGNLSSLVFIPLSHQTFLISTSFTVLCEWGLSGIWDVEGGGILQ